MRTMVVVLDDDGDLVNRLLLTDEQLRLLKWLRDNDYIYGNFQVLDSEQAPIEI